MIRDSASSVNESDARVFRELLLQVHGDISLALSGVAHAQRTTARVRELSRRAGCTTTKQPILDMLEVGVSALSKALQLIDVGLDSGILYLRDISDRETDLIMGRQYDGAAGGGAMMTASSTPTAAARCAATTAACITRTTPGRSPTATSKTSKLGTTS